MLLIDCLDYLAWIPLNILQLVPERVDPGWTPLHHREPYGMLGGHLKTFCVGAHIGPSPHGIGLAQCTFCINAMEAADKLILANRVL